MKFHIFQSSVEAVKAVVKNDGVWINMTDECSSASLVGSRWVVYQSCTLSTGNGEMLTWMRKFK